MGIEVRNAMSRKRDRQQSRTHTPPAVCVLPADPVESLLLRARKLRARGDDRRALVLLRQACALDEWRARSFTLLAALLAELGRRDEAARAFNQARWLRTRAGDLPRARVTERLAAQLLPAAA
jgi:Flp pilus assembly protein TadD